MKQNEAKFLENYKRLEAVCSDIFECQSGVSEYITHMETVESRGRAAVPGWDADYKLLKHLRWLRNGLVHEVQPPEITAQDTADVEDFYNRLLKQQDPLSRLHKAKRGSDKPAVRKASPAPRQGGKIRDADLWEPRREAPLKKPKKRRKLLALQWFLALALFILAALLFKSALKL